MKRIFWIFAAVFFSLTVASVSNTYAVNNLQNQDEIVIESLQDHTEDREKHNSVLTIIRNDGDLEEAKKIAFSIKNKGLKWLTFHNIISDGYVKKGKIEDAVSLMFSIVDEFGFHPNYLESLRGFLLGDLIVSVIDSPSLDDKEKLKKSIFIVSKLNKSFYRAMAIERAVIRFSDKKTIDSFLSEIGYKIDRVGSADLYHELQIIYKKQNLSLICIFSGDVVHRVFHEYSFEQLEELMDSR
ncbi:MAG: hypothetical protein HYW71_00810 [Candidatus Niyogibacteria bacterium]|nr:hypothetical protein [Candidatus Niyogibacteria bacterium]